MALMPLTVIIAATDRAEASVVTQSLPDAADRSDGSMVMITQNTHVRVSGVCASHWATSLGKTGFRQGQFMFYHDGLIHQPTYSIVTTRMAQRRSGPRQL
jgi:hypothetical protein